VFGAYGAQQKITQHKTAVELNHNDSGLKGVAEMTKKEVLVVLLIGLVVNVGGYLCIQKWLRHDAANEAVTSGRR
jgi:hypothetical protein